MGSGVCGLLAAAAPLLDRAQLSHCPRWQVDPNHWTPGIPLLDVGSSRGSGFPDPLEEAEAPKGQSCCTVVGVSWVPVSTSSCGGRCEKGGHSACSWALVPGRRALSGS